MRILHSCWLYFARLCPCLSPCLSLASADNHSWGQTIKHLIFLSQQNSIYFLKCQWVFDGVFLEMSTRTGSERSVVYNPELTSKVACCTFPVLKTILCHCLNMHWIYEVLTCIRNCHHGRPESCFLTSGRPLWCSWDYFYIIFPAAV